MSQKNKTMDTVKKQDLLKKMAQQYKSMDFDEKKEYSCIEEFHRKIKEGP